MAAMHLIFLIFSLTAFSPIANSHDATEIFLKTTLEKAGLKTFSSLIAKTGVLKAYADAENKKGLTIFAPFDSAFSPQILAALKNLTADQVVALLKYHAVGDFLTIEKLKASKGPISTLATDNNGKYTLKVSGDIRNDVIVVAGENLSLIDETVTKSASLAIYKVEKVLLPSEIFGQAAAPAISP